MNGDGLADLLVGAIYADPSGRASAGETYLIYGRSNGLPALITMTNSWLDGTNGVILAGAVVGDFSGNSVSSAGDVNGDGLADLLVGAYQADPPGRASAGETYLVYGRSNGLPALITLTNSWLDGTNGVTLAGAVAVDYSGYSVSSAGDVNGDGLADLLVGAYGADPSGRTSAGETYLIYGRSTAVVVPVSPSSGSVTGGYTVTIIGSNLGNGSDITGVTLCGVSAASITSQSSTQIVVVAGAGTSGLGDVRVISTSYGTTVKSNAFTYLKNDQTISGFLPTNGSVFVQTSTVGLSATASSGLTVTFTTNGGPASISGTNLTFSGAGIVSIVASQAGDSSYNAAPSVTNTFNVTAASSSPVITAQPVSAVVTTGTVVSLSVTNSGTGPFGYQWMKDGVILSGKTNSTLSFSPFKFTDSGSYSVVITNAQGMTISMPASLSVTNASLQTWGFNVAGQLGNGTSGAMANTNRPITVASNVVAAAGGNFHSLFVKADGTLWAMGYNGEGQLGNGTTTEADWPVQVASNVVAAAGGLRHSLFVKADGTLWAMGLNGNGQLGNGTTNNTGTNLPVQVASNVVAAAGGSLHSLFVKADGTLWAMGYNNRGQLGNGTTTQINLPIQVASNVVAAAGGGNHSLFVKADGTLWAMGYNNYGQLGNGTTNTTGTNLPVQVTGLRVAGLAKGSQAYHSLAIALSVVMSDQTITFPTIGNKVTTDTVGLSATASSGLSVTFTTNGGPAIITGGTNLTFTGAGTVSIVASQSGNGSYNAAPNVTNTFNVTANNITTWVGTGDYTDWFDALNWTAGVPASTTVANLPYPAGDASDILISSNTTVQGLIYGASLTYGTQLVGSPGVILTVGSDGIVNNSTNHQIHQAIETKLGVSSTFTAGPLGLVLDKPIDMQTNTLTVGTSPSVLILHGGTYFTVASASTYGKIAGTGSVEISGALTFNFTSATGLGTWDFINQIPTNPLALTSVSLTGSYAGSFTETTPGSWDATAGGMTWNYKAATGVLTATILTETPPAITVQPVSAVVTTGSVVSLSVTNSGTAPFGYKWLKDGVILTNQTSSTLSISSFKFTDSGSYSVVITNAQGMTISVPASLSVSNAPLQVWGYNNYGQLGNGSYDNTNRPITVASNVVAAAGGIGHSLFVKADGTLWAMGYNNRGQLGDGTTTDANLPVQVASNVVAAAGGGYHSLFVKADGTLWAMGDNWKGQLGDGTRINANWPVYVTNNVVAAAAGNSHSLFVKADGTLWAMGDNWNGQLGNGSSDSSPHSIPVQVASNVVAAVGGEAHSLFVKADGTLWGMGYNGYGQLGNGTTDDANWPVCVTNNVVAATAGYAHSLFVKADGTLWGMGLNGGQLGDGSYDNTNLPVQVASNVVAASGGRNHSLFVKADGTLWAMGNNDVGQLGNGTNGFAASTNRPVQVGLLTASLAKAPTAHHSLAIAFDAPVMTDQTITFPAITNKVTTDTVGLSATASSGLTVTFTTNGGPAIITGGTNLSFTGTGTVSIVASQAGNGSYNAAPNVTNTFNVTAASSSPVITAQPVSAVVTTGSVVSLSVTNSGTAPFGYQWMKDGVLLTNQTSSTLSISSFQFTDSGNYSVVITNAQGMTISIPANLSTPNAPLQTWGFNYAGQLGNGTTVKTNRPTTVASNAVAVAVGQGHSLFVKADGTLWTMGYNNCGQLGNGTTNNSSVPISVASNAVVAAGGGDHSLFIKTDGTLWTMGNNDNGQLGNGTTNNSSVPVQVASNVVAAAAGNLHSLFIKTDGTLWTMGDNQSGQLGKGTTGDTNRPVQVASNVVAVAGGQLHSLFVKADGTLWGMGLNTPGQLGLGTNSNTNQPVQVTNNVVAAAGCSYNSLFMKTDGTLWSMGQNDEGSLGIGTTTPTNRPVQVTDGVAAVSGGMYHSLFVKTDGTLWGMGRNVEGQLGIGTSTATSSPAHAANGGLLVASLARGPFARHAMAIAGAPAQVATLTSRTVTFGQTTNFTASVTAGDGPFTYQWQFNGTNIVDATNDSYTIASAALINAGNYAVIVAGTYGTTTSTVATLTVNKANQTITFPAIGGKVTTDTVGLSATATSGLSVTFTTNGGPAIITGGTNLTFSGAGIVRVVASQAGDSTYNAAPNVTNTINVTKAVASVSLSNTNQTYDGTAKSITVTTVPTNLSVSVTYGGSATVPSNAANYTVVATVNEAMYQGGATGTLTIAKASQTVSFTNIGNQLTTNVVTLSATASSGLTNISFGVVSGPAVISGNSVSFTNSGAVVLSAIQNGNTNYNASAATNISFSVSKALASVSLSNTNQTYDGIAKSVTVTTVPTNLIVSVTYNSSATVPSNAANYTVVATVNEAMYQGGATGTLTIAKASQTVSFTNIGDQLTTNVVTLIASSSSSLPVTNFSVVSGPAVISGGSVSFTNSGAVVLSAVQNGNTNYNASAATNISFSVTKALASVSLSNTNQTYDGIAKSVTVTTVPAGRTVDITYNGSTSSPQAAGSYTVVATVNEAMYQGGATGTLTIAKASQTVSFTNIGDQLTTNVVTLIASSSSSLPVTNFSVVSGPAVISGNSVSFTNSGAVVLSAIQNGNTNYNASAATNISFSVTKALASVNLSNTNQTYNGTARVVTATTFPSGRTVDITYNGSAPAPTNAGNYTVIATVNDVMYQGGVTGTLAVAKANQTISFPSIGNQLTTNVVTLSATGGSSTNPVTFVVASGPAFITGGTTLHFSNAGTVSVTADQAGNINYAAAPTATNTFTVSLVPSLTTYADSTRGNDANNGLSWATAKQTIQAAINLVGDGGTVWVTNGTYSVGSTVTPGYTATNRICMNNNSTVKSVNGPAVTLIDGGGAVRCAYLSAGTLSGFTLTNGMTMTDHNWGYDPNGSWEDLKGGGAYLDGGGTLTNCTLSSNSATDHGGGACLKGGGTLNNCTLSGNTGNFGGGAYLTGGGTLNNCTLSGNTGNMGGGAYLAVGGTLNNCTLSGNTGNISGGACLDLGGTLNNCIVWDNSPFGFPNIYNHLGTVRYTCAPDGVTHNSNGCITNNPLFVSTSDFRLQPGSPCINAGNNAYVTTTNDLDGNPRIAFGTVDMGAYESQIPPITVPVALSAIDITSSQFTARWAATDNATNYLIDVSETNTFTSCTGVYSNWSAGNVSACLVTGLVDGGIYYYRVRAANQYGVSTNSNVIVVPVSTNTPYIKQQITNGVASAGSGDILNLNDLFHGIGKSYQIISNSNPGLVSAVIDPVAGTLNLEYTSGGSGTATLTVREWAELGYQGFYVDTEITVYVTDKLPTWGISAVTFNLANGLFEQTICVTNTSLYDAKSVTLTVSNITAGAKLYNATGTDTNGNSEIHWVGTLGGGASMNFKLQYYTAQMGITPTGTVSVSISLQRPDVNLNENNKITLSGQMKSGSNFIIGFNAIIGKNYYIQYASAVSGPWKTAYPPITALTKQVQWVDSGPPATEPAGSSRFYRVIQAD